MDMKFIRRFSSQVKISPKPKLLDSGRWYWGNLLNLWIEKFRHRELIL